MDYKNFTKKELAEMLEIIHSSVVCRDEKDIRALLVRIKELVNGDYCICGIGKGADERLSEPPMIINGNYPAEWLKIYGGNEMYYTDPLIMRNFQNPVSQLWEETYSIYNEKISPLFLSSRDFGLCYGVSGGLYNENRKIMSLFSFSGKGRWFGRHQQEILSTLAPHVHQALARVFKLRQHENHTEQLSAREKEIIKWIKAGKTNWEISVILKISERTVKFHIQNIERKLDAVNKAHAVAILMDQEPAD